MRLYRYQNFIKESKENIDSICKKYDIENYTINDDGSIDVDEVIEYLNEYEVIRDGKVVILQALELVFYEMGLEIPEIEEIVGYQIQY